VKEYVEFLLKKHRATRQKLIDGGKSYRNKEVVWENGFIEACRYMLDAINEPEQAAKIRESVTVLAKMLTEQG